MDGRARPRRLGRPHPRRGSACRPGGQLVAAGHPLARAGGGAPARDVRRAPDRLALVAGRVVAAQRQRRGPGPHGRHGAARPGAGARARPTPAPRAVGGPRGCGFDDADALHHPRARHGQPAGRGRTRGTGPARPGRPRGGCGPRAGRGPRPAGGRGRRPHPAGSPPLTRPAVMLGR
ncbi:hypothetical protein [Ornithinimicrobium kibberense]|uniref:hypothetical protein n=1 Tax=Ornithinimicrobium kibberense TaxID=282060 RepID=UPI00360FA5AC